MDGLTGGEGMETLEMALSRCFLGSVAAAWADRSRRMWGTGHFAPFKGEP